MSPSLLELKAMLAAATAKANRAVADRLPLEDKAAFNAATAGRVAGPARPVTAAEGRNVWNIGDFDFLAKEEPPSTVNPSLWRMAKLNAESGLFKVADGVWQARACDYANMTVIRGETGWILVDPLMTTQTAEAALEMVNDTLGPRPVSAVLLTHTHPDHFGGIRGVADNTTPIYAPEDFMHHAAAEGVLGGNHTSRRAIYQFGLTLQASPEGLVDGGIGKTVAKGLRTFLEPTDYITHTGERRAIDGVDFVFQMASGTEAPAEFTFFLPAVNLLCMAEVCTQTLHNILTPRGAQVRDALLWAQTIDEAITLFGDETDIVINCHNWPVAGREAALRYLEEQRDIYKYIHDQTLRLANLGHTPDEIAHLIEEPDWLAAGFHARGYYGTLPFNARAVYQHYYGFFDGHPVNINPLPRQDLATHYIDAVGGPEAAYDRAVEAVGKDQLQWAATLLNHLVFAGMASPNAVELLALVYRHQGYREESGIMRNYYLTAASELTEGITPLPMAGGRNADLAETLPLRDWFNAYALRLNPERSKNVRLALNIRVGDEEVAVTVNRQVEFARAGQRNDQVDAELVLSRQQLEQMTNEGQTLDDVLADGAVITGDKSVIARYLALHDRFDLWFPIVTP